MHQEKSCYCTTDCQVGIRTTTQLLRAMNATTELWKRDTKE
jgi:hypothetical protein